MSDEPELFTLTRNHLLDLLTTAATLGRNDQQIAHAKTRGDITEILERDMRTALEGAAGR